MADDKNEKGKKSVLFNVTKKETHHPGNGFKKLARRLKANYKFSSNKDEISRDRLGDTDVVVFGGPREPFTTIEFAEIKAWLNSGGRAMVMLGDGGESLAESNMNYLIEEFGMSVNSDSVVRTVFYKYLHPKEVFICDGILVPDLARKKDIKVSQSTKKTTQTKTLPRAQSGAQAPEKLTFVYPYGASLNVDKPARPLLSSGPVSYPMNRPIAAVWEADLIPNSNQTRGRMVVIGSVDIFGDDWIDKEENAKLCDVLFSWLANETDIDMAADRQDAKLQEYTRVPHTEAFSQSLKPCLQSLDEMPKDFTRLFDNTMFRFDVELIPESIKLYSLLSVPHETLTLIPPQFECPLPKLMPAVFPPAIKEPPPPALDQFDLDEHFAKEEFRLAQLTNKCTSGEEDLEYYILEAAEILGITQDLNDKLGIGEKSSAKHVLHHIFAQIVNYKRQDGGKSIADLDGYRGGGLGGGSISSGYDYEASGDHTEDLVVEAKAIRVAPMKSVPRSNNLSALDPEYSLTNAKGKLPVLGVADSKGGSKETSFGRERKADRGDAKAESKSIGREAFSVQGGGERCNVFRK